MELNVWKRCGIAAKVITLICSLVVVATLAVAVFAYQRFNAKLIERERAALSAAAREAGAELVSRIDSLREDVLFLSGTPPIQGIVRTRANGGVDPVDGSSERLWRARLATIFSEILRAKSRYLALRCVGAAGQGRELVRVERAGGGIHTVAGDGLESVGGKTSFNRPRRFRPQRSI